MARKELTPVILIHPGKIIWEELSVRYPDLDELRKQLSRWEYEQLWLLAHEEIKVDNDLARILERISSIPWAFFVGLQRFYDIHEYAVEVNKSINKT